MKTTTITTKSCARACSLVLALGLYGMPAVHAHSETANPEPLLEFTFNELDGTKTPGTGAIATSAILQGEAAISRKPNQGPSGSPSDFALDLTAANAMGNLATENAGVDALIQAGRASQFHSFTLQGWFKSDKIIGDSARLLVSGGSVTLYAGGDAPGILSLAVNNLQTNSAPSYHATNEWVFFAVTYDGTQTSDNVHFYVGGINNPVTLVSTKTLDKGQTGYENEFVIGNISGNARGERPYAGYLDNIRVFGSQEDASGVLTLEQLEVIRRRDIDAKP